MKRILPLAIALAFAGTLLSGCDKNNNRPAGTGSTTTQSDKTPTAPSSPTAPAEKPDQSKRTPAKP